MHGVVFLRTKYNMLIDFYEFAMSNGYFKNGHEDKTAYFDMFFRKVPDGGGFAIMVGVDQLIDYIINLKFSDSDIEFLRGKGIFDEGFLQYLKNFDFKCDVWAVPEGTPVFPGEPIVTVRGPIIQAQLLETMLLLTINHQSLIATKTNRIVRAAEGRPVMEFGSRRAQGGSAAILGARAAFIGGCTGSSCTAADLLYGIPALGTMAHSWVQLYDSEYESFMAYAKTYPDNCILLVDTYNVLKSGVPNAIRVFREHLLPMGKRPKGIRIDSGDITYLTKRARKMLDEAGFADCEIIVSNSLDEFIIRDTLVQGAKIDMLGVGERLITSKSDPVFGGVYKLSAVEENGVLIPKIKVSENISKINLPGFKQLWRLYSNETKKAIADVLTLHDEHIDESKPYEIFDPEHTWKRKTLTNFTAKKLLARIFDKGRCVYPRYSPHEIKEYCAGQIETLWDEVLRFENPHKYYVDYSQKMWDMRTRLLEQSYQSLML